eukprot:SAG11_NODE_5702_length_1483_cov_1.442197_1_plen_87_part_00
MSTRTSARAAAPIRWSQCALRRMASWSSSSDSVSDMAARLVLIKRQACRTYDGQFSTRLFESLRYTLVLLSQRSLKRAFHPSFGGL